MVKWFSKASGRSLRIASRVLLFLLLLSTIQNKTALLAYDPSAKAQYSVLAPREKELPSSRGRFGEERSRSKPSSTVHFEPVELAGGSTLTIITPPRWLPVGGQISKVLEDSHQRLSSLVGEIPSFTTSVRLMDEETFFLATGAPRWTNALFYRGQIIIPMGTTTEKDEDNLNRSVKHEYTHAMIHALTAGKCPGWIDEGLAQWAEGPENPALRSALFDYLKESTPVAFKLMQGGFTRLPNEMVAAAYAQSLIATQALIDTFGFPRMRQYFNLLRVGVEHPAAFERVFGISEAKFERKFVEKLGRWANSYEQAKQLPSLVPVKAKTVPLAKTGTLADLAMAQGF